MDIKTIPLSRLETNLQATLNECADSGQAFVVELPGRRFIAILSRFSLREKTSFRGAKSDVGCARRPR
jgi:hypothetical protein